MDYLLNRTSSETYLSPQRVRVPWKQDLNNGREVALCMPSDLIAIETWIAC